MSPILPPLYKIIIINRECDTERLSHMISICKKLGIDPVIFKAVSADEITVVSSGLNNIKFVKFGDDLYFHDITKSDYPITSGMMAACISYREIYNKLLNDEDSQGYIILEDDIYLNDACNGTLVSLDRYIQELPNWCHFDVSFLDKPRYLCANVDNINYDTSMYTCYSHINFGRNYTQLITKRGATKLLSHFGKWIYKSPEDTLNIACSALFSDIIIPSNPIFVYTDNWTSTKTPLLDKGECIEWYSQNYVIEKDKKIQESLQSYSRNSNNLKDRFCELRAENTGSVEFEAFWINVEKQTNRAEFMINELNTCGIPHTRVDAFTPSTLPNIEVGQNCYVSNLEYACMCSHVKAYEIALQSKVDWFLILEDDMIMYESQKEKVLGCGGSVYDNLKRILIGRPKDAECLQLFCSNPDIQRLLITSSIRGDEWVKMDNSHIGYESKFGGVNGGWQGSQFWGACAYFISRKAVLKNLKRYGYQIKIDTSCLHEVSRNNSYSNKIDTSCKHEVSRNNSYSDKFVNFKTLTHPINPESVVYSHLTCYSHTKSIFTTREDIRSIVHVQGNEWVGHTQQQYCNFVVREKLNYELNIQRLNYELNLQNTGTTHHKDYHLSHKTFIFIIGANSHTSGAYELACILNQDPYQHIEIECDGVLPFPSLSNNQIDDNYHSDKLVGKLNKICMRDYPRVGDVGHYYLPYVKTICGIISHAKFIYLDCDTSKSVDHFMQTTPMQNYWIDSSESCVSSEYDISYPSHTQDGFHTKADMASQYCEDHRKLATHLQELYPSRFRMFSVNESAGSFNKEILAKIYEFLGSPMKKVD
jgi:GR25 family glycosyltransferase involved in LPS biosynthesis